VTPAQCKAARFILGWPVKDLSDRSGVSETTIKSFETGRRKTSRANRMSLTRSFQDAGITFEASDEQDEFSPVGLIELRDGSRVIAP